MLLQLAILVTGLFLEVRQEIVSSLQTTRRTTRTSSTGLSILLESKRSSTARSLLIIRCTKSSRFSMIRGLLQHVAFGQMILEAQK